MHWWFEKYEELSNYMNFEFTIKIYKSVDPAVAPTIEMIAVEVKADPCDECVVTMKAGAKAMFVDNTSVEKDDDWSVLKKGLTYDTNSVSYIKFKLINPENWAGKALQII